MAMLSEQRDAGAGFNLPYLWPVGTNLEPASDGG